MGLREELLQAMEKYFDQDAKRIGHARKVLEFAEQIMAAETGFDPEVIVAAAILHDIGIHVAEKKYGSTAGKYQQIEGPPIAEGILRKINFPQRKIPEVPEIIAHHHSGGIDTLNFKILWDADWLVNLGDEHGTSDENKLAKMVEKVFLTGTGRRLAGQIYLGLK